MLKFDAETTRLLEDAYQGSDFVRRRMANLTALDAKPGETIVDIGSGPGFLTLEIARAVGPQGRVVGVDPSADMRKSAEARCSGRDNVRIVDGTANEMPLEDSSADKAVSLQVFEYLDDIPGALRETRRVLRRNGRLVVGDMHFDAFAWYSADRTRMRRMMKAWDRHLTERCVPELLPAMMSKAGFEVEAVIPVPFTDIALRSDGLANMMTILMSAYAKENALMDANDVDDWLDEQRELASEGRFFFSLCHFVICARKT